jgi:flagellar motor component MotA
VERQVKLKEMAIDGLEAIANGENPRNIEMRLEGYIA